MLESLIGAVLRHEARRAVRLVPCAGPPPAPASPVFLYVHIPFCEVLCPYCSFHRVRFEASSARRYFPALRREIRRYHDLGWKFSGVYVGGGTPTVSPGELGETLALIRSLNPGIGQMSVETNPRDLREDVLSMLQAAGVDRLSVGVQTFDDKLLHEMARLEKFGGRDEILDHLGRAAGRFRTLNVDMIWNLPHQTDAMLESDLDAVLASPANQASFYPLMTSPSAARRISRALGHRHRRPMRRDYERILARLQPAFAATSAWCFTRGGKAIDEYIVDAPTYVGLGSGAFSYVDGMLYVTTFSLQAYVERIEQGLSAMTEQRRFGEREALRYELLVGLNGLRLERQSMRDRHGERFERVLAPELFALEAIGAVIADERGWSLTPRGMFMWVRLMAAFYESVDEFREQMRRDVADELGHMAHERPRIPIAAA
jgi:coproporphyrinogen III oxidase-like Fe-S oxidoreductase